MRRVIADLFERRDEFEHKTPALDVLRLLNLFHDLIHGGLVERRLFLAELAILVDLQFVGQILDDRLVGFQPPQDERRGDLAEQRKLLLVAVNLDGHGKFILEGLDPFQIALVYKVENAPIFCEARNGRRSTRAP